MATRYLTFFALTSFIGITSSQPYNQPLDQFIATNVCHHHTLSLSINSPYIELFVPIQDDHYHWNYTGKHERGDGWTAHLVNMTSQQWLNSSFVDRPIWWHWLWIVIPTKLTHTDYATVVGTNGHNDKYDTDSAPKRDDVFFISCQNIVRVTGSICAVLYQIPNQPLIFHDDPLHRSRSEDAIIAFGWHQYSKYFEQSDPFRYQWITHFPMVKATIRAMDTVSAFASEYENIPKIERFGVSGASKRGWSAWLTAAADRRIEVMAPIVMDMCNFLPNLHHQYKAYGGWTWAFKDYYDENITQDLDAPYFADLISAADPYTFFDRFNERKLWKFIVDGTWDEFFMPDDEQFWWKDLDEPKYLLMNPDADHSQAFAVETDIPSLTTFIGAYLKEVTLPTIHWEISDSDTGNITLWFEGDTTSILDVMVWRGKSCGRKRRDFRMITLDEPCICGKKLDGNKCFNVQSVFTPIKGLQPIMINETVAVYETGPPEVPDKWWEAFMIGLKYRAFGKKGTNRTVDRGENESERDQDIESGDSWFKVGYGEIVWTSQISIVRKEYPFENCKGETCKGHLV